MNTTPTTPVDYRSIALTKLADLALRRTALKEALAPFETQIAAIQKACTDATAEESTAIERLEEDLKQMALRHAVEIFGKDAASISHGLLTLATRPTQKVECLMKEEEVIAALKKASKDHPDQGTRIAAAACLRIKYEINKGFIHDNWEEFAEWFTVFGLGIADDVSASITEKKPAKPKPAKPAKGKKVRAAETELEAAA